MGSTAKKALHIRSPPVSYTHLDVYKRQGYIVMKQIAHINMTIRTSKIISPVVRCLRQFFVAAANSLSPLLVRYRKLPQRAQNRELP